MDTTKSNAIVKSSSIFPTASSSSITSLSSSKGTSSSSMTFLEGLKQIDMYTWLIIFLVFVFLGFNIFTYLAKGTDYLESVTKSIGNAFSPVVNSVYGLFSAFGSATVDLAQNATDAGLTGAQKVISGSATEINKGLASVQNIGKTPPPSSVSATASKPAAPATPAANPNPTPSSASSSVKGQPVNVPKADAAQTNALNNALNNASSNQATNPPAYEADDSNSKIQTGGSKSGWCYIGEDRGFRTCAPVGANDTCMSGNIFPSQEICINPSLRA